MSARTSDDGVWSSSTLVGGPSSLDALLSSLLRPSRGGGGGAAAEMSSRTLPLSLLSLFVSRLERWRGVSIGSRCSSKLLLLEPRFRRGGGGGGFIVACCWLRGGDIGLVNEGAFGLDIAGTSTMLFPALDVAPAIGAPWRRVGGGGGGGSDLCDVAPAAAVDGGGIVPDSMEY